MNRERTAWSVSVVAIAVLAFQLPGGLAHRDDDYAWVRTLVDVHRQVANGYVEPVDEEKLRQGAITGMLGELDPFTNYVPPARQEEFERLLEGTFKGVGIELQQDPKTLIVEVVSPIDGSPAAAAGVMAGDVILQVNGEDIAGMRVDDVKSRITGPVGSEVSLTVKHLSAPQPETLTMRRQEIVIPTVRGHVRDERNNWDWFVAKDPRIAYVRVTQFTDDTFKHLRPLLDDLLRQGMRGLILDLRWNPGGRLDQATQVVDLFLKEGVIVSTRGRNRPERVERAQSDGTLPEFPMVVLVNEHSASAAEIVAGSLKDNNRALVVGTRTYGKGSVQEVIPLDGDAGQLKLTVAYYYLPSGRLVHKKKGATDWGVEPQIAVPMDDATERSVFRQMEEAAYYHRPSVPGLPVAPPTRPAATTGPATTQSSTQPSTQPAEAVDTQLNAALSTLVGHIVLEGHKQAKGETPAPASAPAVRPAP
jgi:carboxyl-terminal processing protease